MFFLSQLDFPLSSGEQLIRRNGLGQASNPGRNVPFLDSAGWGWWWAMPYSVVLAGVPGKRTRCFHGDRFR